MKLVILVSPTANKISIYITKTEQENFYSTIRESLSFPKPERTHEMPLRNFLTMLITSSVSAIFRILNNIWVKFGESTKLFYNFILTTMSYSQTILQKMI